MAVIGKDFLGFDKEVALDFILDIEFKALSSVVPMLKGPWGGFLGFFVKIVLRWQIAYTVEGIHRIQVTVESFTRTRII